MRDVFKISEIIRHVVRTKIKTTCFHFFALNMKYENRKLNHFFYDILMYII